MKTYSIYNEKGLFDRTLTASNDNTVMLNIDLRTEFFIEGAYSSERHYVKDGEVRDLPPRISQFHTFDAETETWLDLRAPHQILHDLADAQGRAIQQINRIRGETRQRFITSIPGQDMVYMEKERSARAWMAEFQATGVEPPSEAYPAISAEIGLTGETAFQVAYIYIHKSEEWRQLSPIIERVSIKYLNLTEKLHTVEELDALSAQYQAEMTATLEAVMQQFAALPSGDQS